MNRWQEIAREHCEWAKSDGQEPSDVLESICITIYPAPTWEDAEREIAGIARQLEVEQRLLHLLRKMG